MGKREIEAKHAKRHKRHKPDKRHKRNAETTQEEIVEPSEDVTQTEEEVLCDGEIDTTAEEIDVGGAEEEMDTSRTTETTPTKPNSNNAATGKGTSSKKSSKTNTPNSANKVIVTVQTPVAAAVPNAAAAANSKKSKRRRESGTSSDEERWLTAIESGKLEDVDDEMKKIKDPKLMTARQRAMYERNLDNAPSPGVELLMSLPTGYREKEKPQTAEEIQKAVLKSQKRKQLADEKREKDKKKTMERLLKKQESKQRSAARKQVAKVTQPMIRYINTLEGAYIQLPPDHEFPLQAQTAREPPKVQLCGIAGCGQPKVYNCSKTNLPLCSFACYRKNVQSIRQMMC